MDSFIYCRVNVLWLLCLLLQLPLLSIVKQRLANVFNNNTVATPEVNVGKKSNGNYCEKLVFLLKSWRSNKVLHTTAIIVMKFSHSHQENIHIKINKGMWGSH